MDNIDCSCSDLVLLISEEADVEDDDIADDNVDDFNDDRDEDSNMEDDQDSRKVSKVGCCMWECETMYYTFIFALICQLKEPHPF